MPSNEIRAAGDSLEIDLYDEIGGSWFFGGMSAKSFSSVLKQYPSASAITLNINSPGGSFTEAIAMRAQLARHPARVTVRVDGIAASAASLVAVAGDEVIMPPGTYMMIHRARLVANGTAADHDAAAARLRSVDADMQSIYAKRSGQDPAKVLADMDAETYFTAAEAVEYGLADRVDGDEVALAVEDFRGLDVPSAIRAVLHTNPAPRATTQGRRMDITALATQLGCAPTNDAVKAALTALSAKAALADDLRAENATLRQERDAARADALKYQVEAKSNQAKAIADALRAEGRLVAKSKMEERVNAAVAAGDVVALETIADMLRELSPAVPVGGRQSTTAGAPPAGAKAAAPMANGKIDYDAVGAALPADVQATYAGTAWSLVLAQPGAAFLWEQAGYEVPA